MVDRVYSHLLEGHDHRRLCGYLRAVLVHSCHGPFALPLKVVHVGGREHVGTVAGDHGVQGERGRQDDFACANRKRRIAIQNRIAITYDAGRDNQGTPRRTACCREQQRASDFQRRPTAEERPGISCFSPTPFKAQIYIRRRCGRTHKNWKNNLTEAYLEIHRLLYETYPSGGNGLRLRSCGLRLTRQFRGISMMMRQHSWRDESKECRARTFATYISHQLMFTKLARGHKPGMISVSE